MVKRLFGYVNGHEVIFMPNPDGKWKAIVPRVSSGSYVVEVQAEDEAGNVSYFARIVYTVDVEKLIFNVVFTEFASDEQVCFTFLPYIAEFKSEVVECFIAEPEIVEYRFELVEAGKWGY